MTKILTTLLIAAVMSCSVVFAQDNLRTSKDNGQKRVEFALHGKTACVMVDDSRIFCAPGIIRAPIKVASSVSGF
ncbi:MAG TPA: hypothetical protein VJT81_20055 [Burkholderiales bacterium]|nr:hypothetical protein [Burkholderiales bacterium]